MQDAAERLHRESIVVDSAAPMLDQQWSRWLAGGASAALATVTHRHSRGDTMARIAAWHRRIETHKNQLALATDVAGIRRAAATNRLAVVLHFQNTSPIEDDLDLLAVYHRLGVRVIQLTYNHRNLVGDGCLESRDAGLSDFGRQVIREMNRLGILVDLSHVGERTAAEALEASEQPVAFTHANAYSVHPHRRNLRDDMIRAVAKKGGVIGVNGYPAFVSASEAPTLTDWIRHVDHLVEVAGVEHVGIGMDLWEMSLAEYEYFLASGQWQAGDYPPPPYQFPINDARELPAITRGLLEHGYSAEQVVQLLGENWLRLFDRVWRLGEPEEPPSPQAS